MEEKIKLNITPDEYMLSDMGYAGKEEISGTPYKINPPDIAEIQEAVIIESKNISDEDKTSILENLNSDEPEKKEAVQSVIPESDQMTISQKMNEEINKSYALNFIRNIESNIKHQSNVEFDKLYNEYMSKANYLSLMKNGPISSNPFVADNDVTRSWFGDNAKYINSPTMTAPVSSMEFKQFGYQMEISPLVAAYNKGYYFDNGQKKSIQMMSQEDLIAVEFDVFGEPHLVKKSWSDDPSALVRTQFGFNDMYSNGLLSTLGRGFYSGASKIPEALSWFVSPFNEAQANRFANSARVMQLMTRDEHDNSALSLLYHTADGIVQMLPVLIAMPPLFQAYRFAGVGYNAASRMAVMTTSIFMGAEAGGAVMNQLIQNGVPRYEAQAHSIIPFMSAIISENILGANIIERAMISGKIKNTAIKEVIEQTIAKTGTIKATSIAGQKAIANKGTNAFFKRMNEYYMKPWSIPVLSGIEQGSEEILEGFMNSFAAPYQNAKMYQSAKNIASLYEGVKYKPLNEHSVLKIMKDGTTSVIPMYQYDAELKDTSRAMKVMENPNLLDTGVNFEEAIPAFFSSFIMGLFSIPSHMSALEKSKKQKEQNTQFSMLAKYYIDSQNKQEAENLIRTEFRNIVNDGVLEHLNVTPEGQPATRSTKVTKADMLEDQFMNTIKLTAVAMETYGLTEKAAIESFEGDTDIYSSVIDIASKLYTINNALSDLENGNIKPEYIDGNVITEKSTVQELQETSEKLKESLVFYTAPSRGGKFSEAYHQKVISTQIYNKMYDKMLGDKIAQDMGYSDYSDPTITEKDKKSIEKKINTQKPKFINTPNAIDIIKLRYQFDQQARSIFAFSDPAMMYQALNELYYGNEKNKSEIAKAILDENNRKIKQSGAILSEESLSQQLAAFEGRQKTVEQLLESARRKKDNLFSASEDLSQVVKEIEAMSELLGKLHITSKANVGGFDISSVKGKINENLTNAKKIVSELTGLEYGESLQDLDDMSPDIEEVFNMFGNDFIGGAMSKETGFIEGVGIVDTENLTPELEAKALDYYSDHAQDYLLYFAEGQDIMHNFTQQAKELLERTKGDNVPNAKAEQLKVKQMADIIAMFDDFFMLEQEVLPSIESDERYAQSSPNYNRNGYRFTPEQIDKIRNAILPLKKELFDRAEKLKGVSSSKNFGQEKRKIVDMWMKYRYMQILSSMPETSDEVMQHIANYIDNVVKHTQELANILGEDKYEEKQEAFRYIYEKFALQDDKSVQRRESIKKALEKVEQSTYELYEKLSGKIDASIKKFAEDRLLARHKKRALLVNYGFKIFDFTKGLPLNYDTTTLETDTLLNPENLSPDYSSLNYPTVSDQSINEAVNDTYDVLILSEWDMINAMGKNGVPSIGNILTSLKNVQSRILEAKQKGTTEYSSFIPTFEQEQAIIQMIVNTSRKGKQSFLPKEVKGFIDQSIYLRGFAGTGKTSIVLDNYILAMAELLGKKNITIEIYVPSEKLLQEHKEQRESIKSFVGKDTSLNFKYSLFSEYGNNSKPDILIFDEISSIGQNYSPQTHDDYFKLIQQQTKDKGIPVVLLGDDSQVSNNAEGFGTGEKQIARITNRIQPLSEIHRGKVVDINNLVNRLRLLGQGAVDIAANSIADSFAYNETHGVEVFADKGSLIQSALNYMLENPEVIGNDKKMSIVAYDEAEKISIIEQGKNAGLGNIEGNIYLMNPLTEKEVGGKVVHTISEKDFMSGLGSEVVFVTYDYEQALKDIDESAMRLNINERKKIIYDNILTAVSRSRNRVSLLSTKGQLKSQYSPNIPIIDYESSSDDQYLLDLEQNINRYNEISKNLKKDEQQEEETTEDVDEEINITRRQGISYKAYNNKALKGAEKIVGDTIKGQKKVAKTLPRVSELIFANVQSSLRSEENRQKSKIFRLLLESFIADEAQQTELSNQIMAEVEKLVEIIKKIDPNTKFTANSYIAKLLQSPPSTLSMLNTMSNFKVYLNSQLVLKHPKGEYSVSPFMMAVVGEVNGKPVVDIIDFVYKPLGTDNNPTTGTSKTMAMLVKAAEQNGFLVNNVIANVFIEDVDGSAMFGSEVIYSPETIQEILQQEGLEKIADESFITEQQYYEQSRIIPVSSDLDEVYSASHKGQVSVLGKVRSVSDEKYLIKDKNKTILVDEQTFKNEYVTKQEKWKRVEKFSESAKVWQEKQAFYGMSRFTVLSYNENGKQVNVQTKDNMQFETIEDYDNKKLDIIKLVMNGKIAMTQSLVENVAYITDDGQVRIDGYGIVNTINPNQLLALRPNLTDNEISAFTTMSFNALPEMSYRVDGKISRVPDSMIKAYLEAETESDANMKLEEIKGMMNFNIKESNFESEMISETSTVDDQLNIDKNIALLEHMRLLKAGPISVEIAHTDLFASKGEKSFSEFEQEMNERGIKIGDIQRVDTRNRKHTAVEVSIGNNKAMVYFRNKRFVNTNTKNFTNEYKDNIKDMIVELNEVKKQFNDKLSQGEDRISREVFREIVKETYDSLRQTDAFNFLIYNTHNLQAFISEDVLSNFIELKDMGNKKSMSLYDMKQSTVVGNIKSMSAVMEMLKNIDTSLQENREIISTFVLSSFNKPDNMLTINGNVGSIAVYTKPTNSNFGGKSQTGQRDLNIEC